MYTEIRNDYTLAKLGGIIIGTLIFFASLPAHAYFTTNQEAIALNEKTLLFTIEYRFGMEKYDLYMPILAMHDGVKATTTLSYTILDEDGTPAKGTPIGIVFSDTPITHDGMYKIEKGTVEKFSLQVLFTPEPGDTEKKYRLQVTDLPFNFDGKQQLQLNPSELKYYTTGMKGF